MATEAEVLTAFRALHVAMESERDAAAAFDKAVQDMNAAQVKHGEATRTVEAKRSALSVLARQPMAEPKPPATPVAPVIPKPTVATNVIQTLTKPKGK